MIGNSAYQNASKLTNPVNDANAMADLFRRAGFDVVEAKLDLGNLEFKRVAREFTAGGPRRRCGGDVFRRSMASR